MMFKNPEFETLKERLRKLKLIRRKEKDELKRLEIDEKIDKYQDKIDIIKEKFLEKGWVEGKNGFELADDDDDDDDDDGDDDDDDDNNNKDNRNKPNNIISFFVLLISGFIAGFYYVYLNSAQNISNAMLVCNISVFLFPGVYQFIYPVRRSEFQISIINFMNFLAPLFPGILIGIISSFFCFYNTILPDGLDWGPLLLIVIFCFYSVFLLSISGYIDADKVVPEGAFIVSIILYYFAVFCLVLMLLGYLFMGLDNYFKNKRNGIRATEINFIDHLGTKL